MSAYLLFPFLVALLIGASPAIVLAECAPPLTGAPCAQGGLATLHHTEPSLNLGAGNPIHLVTGNNYQKEQDLPAGPGHPGLELLRHYNTFNTHTDAIGTGWSLSYDTRLYRMKSSWQIVQADGSRITFSGHLKQNQPLTGPHGQLELVNHRYQWRWPNQAVLGFDEQGLLTDIHQPGHATVLIHRYPAEDSWRAGLIQHVINQYDQHLDFHYAQIAGRTMLQRVSSPLGDFYYQYDGQHRLTHLTRPDGMQRRYAYEPRHQAGQAHLLTGIAVASHARAPGHRLNTWVYDSTGRAVQSYRGTEKHPHSQVALEYTRSPTHQHPGLTIVSNAQQKATYFHTALRGTQYVLERVEGSECPGCARPGTRAQYDNDGRLVALNHVKLVRHADGTLKQLSANQHAGWPGLQLNYRADGLRSSWHSQLTGTETMVYDQKGRPRKRIFANGDRQQFDYHALGQPQTLIAQHAGKQSQTSLRWYGHQLMHIDHPGETEQREYDAQKRLIYRAVARHCRHQPSCFTYQERFAYDDQDRLIRHELPEGGRLEYGWGAGAQLTTIDWIDTENRRHPIINTVPGLPGYRYGNGLHLHTRADEHDRVHRLALASEQQALLEHQLAFDDRQRIRGEHIRTALPDHRRYSARLQQHLHRYAYNAQDQLVISQTDPVYPRRDPVSTWLAWRAGGELTARRQGLDTQHPRVHRDASGLPTRVDELDLGFAPNRRLAEVRRNGRIITRYRHNAFGHQIAQYTFPREGSVEASRHFFYLGDQLVAESDIRPIKPSTARTTATVNGPAPERTYSHIHRRYIYAHHVPIAIIQYHSDPSSAQLFYIHADLIGAPRLVTDEWKNIRWQADYTALGKTSQLRGDIRLDLRLPGQVADATTGLHDNLLRTYHPGWGQYLEPDPLGPLPVSQAFGYAVQQPRRYVDPTGLLLFAFDGTRQSASTQGNVWKLSQHYLDGPVYYHPGPGDSHRLNWDAITARSADAIIEQQWRALLSELATAEANETIPIDILGFSRGAALARHFGNLVSSHVSQDLFEFHDAALGTVTACVDLRFMGLFDSVAQFGLTGSRNAQYDLAIPAAWGWVAHAAALHERRMLFPLLSATGNSRPLNVVESPFVGAHSDIGGGILPAERSAGVVLGDLSNVTLNWMLWQASAASVRFGPLDGADRVIETPLLHDHRPSFLRRIKKGDRSIESPDGTRHLMWQDEHPELGQKQRDQTEAFINRPEGWPAKGGIEAGTVDMDAYARWLHDELGWRAPPV